MLVKRIMVALPVAVAPVLGVVPSDMAMAEYVITSSFDKEVVHRGDSVALRATFKNPETVDVTFTFLTVNPSYATMLSRTKYTNTGCSGEITSCNHYTVPIAPGATRTVTLTYDIAADSPCGESTIFGFYFYSYRESSAGAFDTVVGGAHATVLC